MTCATIPSPVLHTCTHRNTYTNTLYRCIVASIAVNTWHSEKISLTQPHSQGTLLKKTKPYLLTFMVWHPDSLIDTKLAEESLFHALFLFPGWAGNLTRPEEDVWPWVSVAAEGYRVEGLRDPADHPGTGPGNLHYRMQCEWAPHGLFYFYKYMLCVCVYMDMYYSYCGGIDVFTQSHCGTLPSFCGQNTKSL